MMKKRFLLVFCADGYIAEESKGFIIGDKIIATSGPLEGRESIIKKIDRHKNVQKLKLHFLEI